MHYTEFRVRNFKGIRDTTIRLAERSSVGVFAFVGLNESGKTTILEAIHSFSPDSSTGELVGGGGESGVPFPARVPRHQISNFTGDVSVTATARLSDEERAEIVGDLKREAEIILDPASIPEHVQIERQQRFENGDFVKSFFTLRTEVRIKTGRQRKWRAPDIDEQAAIRDEIYDRMPDIAYFPTFVFDFPKRIYLTEGRGNRVTNFYRQTFQDILDFNGEGHTIEDSIVRRVRSEDKQVPWLAFMNIWNTGDDKDKIQHVMDRAGASVTEVVFGRWNEIFGEDARGKEINISFETLQGEVRDSSGAVTQTNEHDLFVKFQIKDGTRRFDVNDRSLGFRWFFAFMMFTQFRAAREDFRPVLFLFDEPASNLHAAAQKKLIDSFPSIALGNNTLAYTTHSHYMIEPKWLEQTFIVTNRADSPSGSVLDALSLSDESLDIRATPYRSFVDQHPSQTSYFQPVLDRLEVVPSRFDLDRASVIVEGKSDYYILRFALQRLKLQDISIIPGMGAGTFGALVALHLGWGLGILVLLDGDTEGKKQKARYAEEYGLREPDVMTLTDLAHDVVVIEDLLDDHAKSKIQAELSIPGQPTKRQIQRFFQERLACDDTEFDLGSEFEKRAGVVLEEIAKRLREV